MPLNNVLIVLFEQLSVLYVVIDTIKGKSEHVHGAIIFVVPVKNVLIMLLCSCCYLYSLLVLG